MINATIDATKLNLRIQTIGERLKNTRPLMDSIGDYVVGSVRKNIEEGGRSDRYAPNIRGNTPLLRTGESYFKVQKNDISDTSVTVSSAGGNAGYSNTEHDQIVTPMMKRFFMFKYWETKERFWLAMALKKKLHKPKRRYMMFQQPFDVEEIKKMVSAHLQLQ
jgi:phage gpG-like protein